MSKITWLLTLIICAPSLLTFSQQSALKNKDVIDLVKVGLSSEIIIAKIKISKTEFDTSPAALSQLKNEGIPDGIVVAMIEASTPALVKPDEPTRLVLVPEGTSFQARATITFSSDTATEGEPLTFKVDEDVIIDGYLVIAEGADVQGTVIEAESSGERGKGGKLRIELRSVVAVDKRRIKVRGLKGKAGEDKSGKSTAMAARGNIFARLVTGETAKIEKGTIALIYTDEDKEIKGIKKLKK